MNINEIIKEKRIQMGLTMLELSQIVGVSEGTISRWESGDIENMRRDKIGALARALNISPAVIMGWEDPHSNNTINGNNNIIGNGNTVSTLLTEAEQALLDMYNQMNIIKKSKLIAYASELLKEP